MIVILRRIALALTFAASVVGCAAGAAGHAPNTTTRPEMIGRDFPDLSILGSDPALTRVEVTVMVDPDGRPDMKTVKVVGTSSASTRDAFTSWIGRNRFKPGMQNGQPVRAQFEMQLRTSRSRRIG